MALMKSLVYFVKESRLNPVTLIHVTFYSFLKTYLRVLDWLLKLNIPGIRNHVAETYHGKVLLP